MNQTKNILSNKKVRVDLPTAAEVAALNRGVVVPNDPVPTTTKANPQVVLYFPTQKMLALGEATSGGANFEPFTGKPAHGMIGDVPMAVRTGHYYYNDGLLVQWNGTDGQELLDIDLNDANWTLIAGGVDQLYVDTQDAAIQNFVITERDALYDHVDQADAALQSQIDTLGGADITSLDLVRDSFIPGMPANYIGLKPGDITTAMDSRIIKNTFDDFGSYVRFTVVGSTAEIHFFGKSLAIAIYDEPTGGFNVTKDAEAPYYVPYTAQGYFMSRVITFDTTDFHTVTLTTVNSAISTQNIIVAQLQAGDGVEVERAILKLETDTHTFEADLSELLNTPVVQDLTSNSTSVVPSVAAVNAALVHKTGNETLAGLKTFANPVSILGVGDYFNPLLSIVNSQPFGEAKISIRGSASDNTAARLEIGQSAGGNAYMMLGAFANLDIGTNGQTRIRVTQNGNVGIGTTTPDAKLHILGDADGAGVGSLKITSTTSSSVGAGLTLDAVGGSKYSLFSSGFGAGIGGGNFCIFDSSAVAYRFIMTSTGNVGIGSTLPTERLVVSGKVKATAFIGDGSQLTNLPVASYTLPVATASVLGGIMVGANLSIDGAGVLAATSQVQNSMSPTTMLAPSVTALINVLGNNAGLNTTYKTTIVGAINEVFGFNRVVTSNGSMYFNTKTNLTGANNTLYGSGAGNGTTSGANNTYVGQNAGYTAVSANRNTAVGWAAGYTSTGSDNVFLGYQGGASNTTGYSNVFLGVTAGLSNTTGYYNTVTGFQAGYSMGTGSQNTFYGANAGAYNQGGTSNVAIGFNAGYFNTANYNMFIGDSAGYNNTTGVQNTYLGYQAGYNTTTGGWNVAIGYQAGRANTVNYESVFIGNQAGYNTTGGSNTFVGAAAGTSCTTGQNNVAIGKYAGAALGAGNGNTLIGQGAGQKTSGSNNVMIGFGTGYNITTATNICMIGYNAGALTSTASGSTFFGTNAGYNVTTGINNTALGFGSGPTVGTVTNSTAIGYNAKPTVDNTVIIGNAADTANKVGIGTTTPTSKLTVNGDIEVSAGFGIIVPSANGTRYRMTPSNDGLSTIWTAV